MDDYNALIVREHYDLLAAISACEKQKKEIDKQEKAMRELLLKAMEDKGLWDITFEEGEVLICGFRRQIPGNANTANDTGTRSPGR